MNTDGFNSGMPFCKSRKTIENERNQGQERSVTHRTVQKPFFRILVREWRSAALRELAGKSIEVVASVIASANSSGGFFGVPEDRLSSHID